LLKKNGLQYFNIPLMDADDINAEFIRKVEAAINNLPKPTLIHCKVGLTAAVSALLVEGKLNSSTANDVISWGGDLGYNFTNNARLYKFIQEFMKQENKN